MPAKNVVTAIMRGSTPSLMFRFRRIDPDLITDAFLTIRQGDAVIERDLSTATQESASLSWKLTQAETLSLTPDDEILVQLRWRTTDGTAGGSRTYKLDVTGVLKDGEIGGDPDV